MRKLQKSPIYKKNTDQTLNNIVESETYRSGIALAATLDQSEGKIP